MALYNLKSSDGQWRITKFDNDLNVESSYIVSLEGCDCPAGSRPVCRHRTMLPKMLNVGAEDSGMFYDYNTDQFLEPMADDEDTQPAIVSPMYQYDEQECPGHVASKDDAKICALCGTHVDSLRPEDEVELPPQAAQDMLSQLKEQPATIDKNSVAYVTPHPALSGPLKRRI
jgi:hypothetical protein